MATKPNILECVGLGIIGVLILLALGMAALLAYEIIGGILAGKWYAYAFAAIILTSAAYTVAASSMRKKLRPAGAIRQINLSRNYIEQIFPQLSESIESAIAIVNEMFAANMSKDLQEISADDVLQDLKESDKYESIQVLVLDAASNSLSVLHQRAERISKKGYIVNIVVARYHDDYGYDYTIVLNNSEAEIRPSTTLRPVLNEKYLKLKDVETAIKKVFA